MAARMIRDTAGPEALQKLSEELRSATAIDNPPSADIPSPTPVRASDTSTSASTTSLPSSPSITSETAPTIPSNPISEMPAPTSGAAVSSASTAVSDARLDEARTPIVTTMPATTSTPRPRIEDSAPAGQIASVYNEELMRDIFGNRQQAFG
jgi:hypothetical protein